MFQNQKLIGIAESYVWEYPDVRYQFSLFLQVYDQEAKVAEALRSDKLEIFGVQRSRLSFLCFSPRSGDAHE